MLEKKIRDLVLVDELQLNGRPAVAVNAGDRAEFDLLMSMLSQDVTDAPLCRDDLSLGSGKKDLRSYFELQNKRRDYAEGKDFEHAAALSSLLHEGNMRDVFLSSCLNPEPFCEYERRLAPEVYSSLSPLLQEKFNTLVAEEKIQRVAPSLPKDGFEIMDEGRAQESLDVSV